MTTLTDILAGHSPIGQTANWRCDKCRVPWSVQHVAQAVAAAGLVVSYPVIETVEELDALPDFVVVRYRVGTIWEKEHHGGGDRCWWQIGLRWHEPLQAARPPRAFVVRFVSTQGVTMSRIDPLHRLYNDPAAARVMDVLREHAYAVCPACGGRMEQRMNLIGLVRNVLDRDYQQRITRAAAEHDAVEAFNEYEAEHDGLEPQETQYCNKQQPLANGPGYFCTEPPWHEGLHRHDRWAWLYAQCLRCGNVDVPGHDCGRE